MIDRSNDKIGRKKEKKNTKIFVSWRNLFYIRDKQKKLSLVGKKKISISYDWVPVWKTTCHYERHQRAGLLIFLISEIDEKCASIVLSKASA